MFIETLKKMMQDSASYKPTKQDVLCCIAMGAIVILTAIMEGGLC